MGIRESALEGLGSMKGLEFWKGKRVFLTGHTGFKGTWLSVVLVQAGAELTGYALEPPTQPSLFAVSGVEKHMRSVIDDVRDLDSLKAACDEAQPEVVIHMAAQPLVRDSYQRPRYTYETNVMGTVNVLECLRVCDSVRSFVNVTTDKVYENRELNVAFTEDEKLDGYDPYSNSKSCSELVTHSYKSSFFHDSPCAISTVRAGNVIGGGDFAANRIIPDCVRAAMKREKILVRNPYSIRPYQHVLEPLMVYLMLAEKQYHDQTLSGWYNVGPDACDCVTTGDLATLFCEAWGDGQTWVSQSENNAPHEAGFLQLDCTKLKQTFQWEPTWHIAQAIEKTVEWTKVWVSGGDVPACMSEQIQAFMR